MFLHALILLLELNTQDLKKKKKTKSGLGMFLAIQWLRLRTSNADSGLIPIVELRSCMPRSIAKKE